MSWWFNLKEKVFLDSVRDMDRYETVALKKILLFKGFRDLIQGLLKTGKILLWLSVMDRYETVALNSLIFWQLWLSVMDRYKTVALNSLIFWQSKKQKMKKKNIKIFKNYCCAARIIGIWWHVLTTIFQVPVYRKHCSQFSIGWENWNTRRHFK